MLMLVYVSIDLFVDDWWVGGFVLYVYWFFCVVKCFYCDFNSYVLVNIDQICWLVVYLIELVCFGVEMLGCVLNSIFFGGGMFSLMVLEIVYGIIDVVCVYWFFVNDIEIMFEVNFISIEISCFCVYVQVGVNCVLMGMQVLNDDDLKCLGWMYLVVEGCVVFDIVCDCFLWVSFDLIYVCQDQDRVYWCCELIQVLVMVVDYLLVY